MSDTENQNDAVEAAATNSTDNAALNNAKDAAGNILSNILAVKESNPKVFYGGLGGIVLLLLIMMFSGGSADKPKLPGPSNKNVVVGQKYVLQSPNSFEKDATIKLVPVPGTVAAYDDTEEEEAQSTCRRIKQGTSVSVMSLSDAYGKKDAFAQVKIEDGECKGKDGWALTIDLQ